MYVFRCLKSIAPFCICFECHICKCQLEVGGGFFTRDQDFRWRCASDKKKCDWDRNGQQKRFRRGWQMAIAVETYLFKDCFDCQTIASFDSFRMGFWMIWMTNTYRKVFSAFDIDDRWASEGWQRGYTWLQLRLVIELKVEETFTRKFTHKQQQQLE